MNAPVVDIAVAAERARWLPAWRDLVGRAEPNAFADPSFLLPALDRLAEPGRVRLVLVWRDGGRSELMALMALTPPRFGLGFARVWRHEQAALGAILVDRKAAAAALAAFNAWLERSYPASAGWIAPLVGAESAFVAAAQSLGVAINPRQRAALIAGKGARSAAVGTKHRREWDRGWRRLGERGRLDLRSGADGEAIERFLALEASGWKGESGTALTGEAGRAAFAREMLAGFAQNDGLRIHQLALDDRWLAAVVELRSGGRGYFWKIAYDERFAEFSPGVQLLRAASRRLEADASLDLVDSCAEADHPLIGRLWSDRWALVDLAVLSGNLYVAKLLLAQERAFTRLRAKAKRLWLSRLRRR